MSTAVQIHPKNAVEKLKATIHSPSSRWDVHAVHDHWVVERARFQRTPVSGAEARSV
jgi:hypothetical protein